MSGTLETSGFIRLDGVSKAFGPTDDSTVAIASVDLTVDEGEFLSVVGPSGCGKSTLLQIIAGLMPATAGRVTINDQIVNRPPESMVYLFQQYSRSLFPWRTALDNVAFATEHHKATSRKSARSYSRPYLEMVGLSEFAQHYPWQLSGGMQQRVVIARALAAQPRVLLLDEPFSSVDALTRVELHNLILELWEKNHFTVVLVTHDVDEAVFLADRVAVLSGRPSMLVRSIATKLPRPRDAITTRESPQFLALRHDLLSLLLESGQHAK
jgi:NitT/TauT family transport system ATP-binding protein